MRRAYVLNVLEMQAYLLQVTDLLVKRIVQFYSNLSLTENDNQEVNPISFRENKNLEKHQLVLQRHAKVLVLNLLRVRLGLNSWGHFLLLTLQTESGRLERARRPSH